MGAVHVLASGKALMHGDAVEGSPGAATMPVNLTRTVRERSIGVMIDVNDGIGVYHLCVMMLRLE